LTAAFLLRTAALFAAALGAPGLIELKVKVLLRLVHEVESLCLTLLRLFVEVIHFTQGRVGVGADKNKDENPFALFTNVQ
jgi:hypothetical protein